MIITESDLRAQLRRPAFGARVVVPDEARLSPSAQDFISQWQLVRVSTPDVEPESRPEPSAESPATLGERPLSDVVYLMSTAGCPELAPVARALVRQLGPEAGVFRPLAAHDEDDRLTRMLASQLDDPSHAVLGATLLEALTDETAAMTRIVEVFTRLRESCPRVLVIGTDFDGPTAPLELRLNAQAAANLGATVVLLAPGELEALAGLAECRRNHASVGGVLLLHEGRVSLPVPSQLIGVGGAAANTSTFRVDPALMAQPAQVAMLSLIHI